MDAQDFRSLQEAYNQVHQVDEAEKWIQKAIKKPGALSKQLGVPEEENIPVEKLKSAAKKGGKLGKRARLAMTLKGLHREEIDIYDIILTHLLDEGYADTQEAALKIMANMSEEWRQSIVEAVQIPPIGKPQRYISPSRPIPTSSTPIPDRSTPADKKIGQKISQTPAGMRLTGPTGPLR